MKTIAAILNLLRKAWMKYRIRSVEIELAGNYEAFPYLEDPRVQHAMLIRRKELSRLLCRLRGEYRAQFGKAGQVVTYGMA